MTLQTGKQAHTLTRRAYREGVAVHGVIAGQEGDVVHAIATLHLSQSCHVGQHQDVDGDHQELVKPELATPEQPFGHVIIPLLDTVVSARLEIVTGFCAIASLQSHITTGNTNQVCKVASSQARQYKPTRISRCTACQHNGRPMWQRAVNER